MNKELTRARLNKFKFFVTSEVWPGQMHLTSARAVPGSPSNHILVGGTPERVN